MNKRVRATITLIIITVLAGGLLLGSPAGSDGGGVAGGLDETVSR